jgi:hypothetical protein
MEEYVEISLLYDFYGAFLTDKQKEAVEHYYDMNYSLAEIGEKMGITRQGVRDLLLRSKEVLHDFDQKLDLMHKYQKQQTLLQQSMDKLQVALTRTQDQDMRRLLEDVQQQLKELMDEA